MDGIPFQQEFFNNMKKGKTERERLADNSQPFYVFKFSFYRNELSTGSKNFVGHC